MARIVRLGAHLVVAQQPGGRLDAVLVGWSRSISKRSGRQQRRRPAVAHLERGGLAGHADVAVVVLDDAVEEHGDEAAVHDPRRSFVEDGELDRARGPVAVDT